MLKAILIATAILAVASSSVFGQSAIKDENRDLGYLVLGTISSVNKKKGVALLKHRKSKKTKAVRVGGTIEKNLLLVSVSKKIVSVSHHGKISYIRVGSSERFDLRGSPSYIANNEGGLQTDGNKVVVSENYKNHLIKNDLNKILMQAAAVPSFKNGRLSGFTLMEIVPGSIYEKLGFKNGDTVTSINDTNLVDASQAVKVLLSLKSAKNLALNYVRGGVEQHMEIRVQ